MPTPKKKKVKVAKVAPVPHETPKSPDGYVITLRLGNDVYSSTGETAYESLRDLVHPLKIVSKGTLILQKGEWSREMLLQPPRLRRLFWPNAQEIQAKILFAGIK